MANRIDLVRHPDKEGDAEGLYIGPDARITERGWQEAEVVVERLSRLPHELIMCSQVPRAIGLAKMYAERLKYEHLEPNALLNEIDKPRFLRGLLRADPIHVGVMQTIRDCFDSGQPPELSDALHGMIEAQLGLTLPRRIHVKDRAQLEAETRALFRFIEARPEEAVLGVSHAKRIASLVHWTYRNGTLERFYEEADKNLTIDTTGITTLVRKPDRRTKKMRWQVLTVNDTSHYEEATTRKFLEMIGRLE